MQVSAPFDLIIFDCDGVLIDSEPIAARIHAEALTELGHDISAEEIMRRFSGLSDRAWYPVIEVEMKHPLPADYPARARLALERAFRQELRPIPGIDAALAALAVPLCVASGSSPERLRFTLECAGLHHRFAPHIFSAAMVARGKPAPDLFLFAAEQMQAAPSRCLVIEDSVAGVQAARAADMAVLGFCGGGHCGPAHAERLARAGAKIVFRDMQRLPHILSALPTARTASRR